MIPFSAFNFKVRLTLEGESTPICEGAFSEVSGLELSLTPQTIRQGGANGRQIHLAGPVSHGQLTLKRGATEDFGLWHWFRETARTRRLRAGGEIAVLSADRETETMRFLLTGCLPVKLRAPTLNAADGILAIEEMTVAYATLDIAEA